MPPRWAPTIKCIHCQSLIVKYRGKWHLFGTTGQATRCRQSPNGYHSPSGRPARTRREKQ